MAELVQGQSLALQRMNVIASKCDAQPLVLVKCPKNNALLNVLILTLSRASVMAMMRIAIAYALFANALVAFHIV